MNVHFETYLKGQQKDNKKTTKGHQKDIKISKRGGARKGSGPKVKGPYRRRSVCIDDKTYDIVKKLGNGNFSRGCRKLCAILHYFG